MAVKLLGYGRLLRNIAGSNSFDYSVAQAASKWIAESIQGCSGDFLRLVDPARSLKDVVSLSSGLGITEIWSTLSVHRPICASLTDLRSLETIARDIDSTCDVHGVLITMLYPLSCIQDIYLTRPSHANFPSDGIAHFIHLAN